jgi:hypothetical protein
VPSRALLRGDGGESRYAFFDIDAATVRARDPFLIMLSNAQNSWKDFLTGMAEELIVGHIDLPRNALRRILVSGRYGIQLRSSRVAPHGGGCEARILLAAVTGFS